MAKGSGTRSGMLWEVERILEECKEINTLPNILIMENVPEVIGTKNKKSFDEWTNKLHELGYMSFYKILNAKNYGVPQNRERCFMVSILGDNYKYDFPTPITLTKRLKDILEKEVAEKYYLSDNIVSKLAFNKNTQINEKTGIDLCDTKSEFRDICNTIKSRYDCGYEHFSPGPTGVAEPQLNILAKTKDGNNFNSVYLENGLSPTLLARDYKDPVRIAELKQVAQMYPNSGNPQAGRIYDKEGLSPCLDTCQGVNREVKIVEQNCSTLQKEVCNKAIDFMKEGDVIDYTYSNSRLKEMKEGYIKTKNSEDNSIMNTLTTVCENFGIAVSEKEPQCIQREIQQIVKVRKFEVNEKKLQEILRNQKSLLELNNDEIAKKLNVPKTNVEHWFRTDKYFSIPTPEIWYQLKELLDIETDEFDESITTFEEKLSEFDMSNRAYDDNGISPTITTDTIDKHSVKQNLRIRKLTPHETFRLMGVKDTDFEKIAKNQSNASLYHLSGDSLITLIISALILQMLPNKPKTFQDIVNEFYKQMEEGEKTKNV